ncbi:MAG: hypothetical protein INF34_12840 [Roseomonas sp.]|nr:hypothetical protein [Roseomonas sp.]MCA3427588.1 hypothetical protein [Roseomonas sp.]
MSGSVDALNLPPEEAIRFFRAKVNTPTRAWDDLRHGAHARAWSVAGVQADDMLADIRRAMDKAIAQGTTLDEFRRDIAPLLGELGWADRGPGYVGWRTRVIYETNMRTAYAAGRYAQMTDPDVLAARPFWRYRHSGKRDARKQHKAWDGLVLRADDPFWQTHYPPNGWGCGCFIQSLGPRDLARAGKTGPDEAPPAGTRPYRDPTTGEISALPAGIDPGWDYNVGQSWLQGVVPREAAQPLRPLASAAERQIAPGPMPAPRPAVATTPLPEGLTDAEYVERFLAEFGATADRPAVFRDASGTRITIGTELFEQLDGALKVNKRGRARFLLLMAQALKDPDEIWIDWVVLQSGAVALRRRYLRRAGQPGGSAGFTVFEWTRAAWYGVTTFSPSDRYVEGQRNGALIYRRPEE